ncbi:unnamed protein product, partial [Mesorhabditis spiculigera]
MASVRSSRLGPLLLLTLFFVAGQSMDLQHWQCGSEAFTKNFSYTLVHNDCPAIAGDLNHCCVVHDDCYVKQKGQEYCDKVFCDCTTYVLHGLDAENCQSYSDTTCLMMPFFGSVAYENSYNWTPPANMLHLRPPGALIQPFDQLYSACPDVSTVLSSCSYNYIECGFSGKGIMNCGRDLSRCITTATAEIGGHCAVETERISDIIKKETYRFFDLTDSSNMYLLKMGLLVFVIVFIFFSLFTLLYRHYNRWVLNSRGSMEDIKYQSV